MANIQPEDAVALDRVLALVRQRTGIDFNGYRPATLHRRVRNRMISANIATLPAYLEKLEADPLEAAQLVERLTIKVSRFFRDLGTFRALSAALARLRETRPGPLSIWSAGCGFGEEPYGLAILLLELGAADADILATDVDPAALDAARRAEYPEAALEDLPAPLRGRYLREQAAPNHPVFVPVDSVRARVRFELHDLAAAASAPDGGPFDLVCCRNVLIYLQPRLQQRVESLLARSIKPGGLLLLGEAEWLLAELAPAFEVVDRRARLFRFSPSKNEGPR